MGLLKFTQVILHYLRIFEMILMVRIINDREIVKELHYGDKNLDSR